MINDQLTQRTPLAELHAMFYDAFYQKRKINYIVSGDSLRGNSPILAPLGLYYRDMFAQINIDVVFTPQAGLLAEQWRTNVSSNTKARLEYAVTNSLGTEGEDTILEFEMGINDDSYWLTQYGTATEQQYEAVKSAVRNAIRDYKIAKPKAKVLMVAPCYTGNMERTLRVGKIYKELSIEFGAFLVDGLKATNGVRPFLAGTPPPRAFYTDLSHPNINGARRIFNYMFEQILPISMLSFIKIVPFSSVGAETALINQAVIDPIAGLWNQTTGASMTNANWRRLQLITVEPSSLMKLKHQGERRDLVLKRVNGTYYTVTLPEFLTGQTHWLIEIPSDVDGMKVNLTSNGTTYDALNDVVELNNIVPVISYNMPTNKINEGLKLKISE